MKTAICIYLRAQGLYALLTVPALLFFPVYFYSEALALFWGSAGLAVFLPVLPLIRAAPLRRQSLAVLLVLAAGLAATFLAVWLACHAQADGTSALQSMLDWWPFPAAAFLATIIAVIRERCRIRATICAYRDRTVPSGYGAPL